MTECLISSGLISVMKRSSPEKVFSILNSQDNSLETNFLQEIACKRYKTNESCLLELDEPDFTRDLLSNELGMISEDPLCPSFMKQDNCISFLQYETPNDFIVENQEPIQTEPVIIPQTKKTPKITCKPFRKNLKFTKE